MKYYVDLAFLAILLIALISGKSEAKESDGYDVATFASADVWNTVPADTVMIAETTLARL